MLKTSLLSILLFSSVSYAQFTTPTTSLTFDSVVNGSVVGVKEIEFTNNSASISSIQLSLDKRAPLSGVSTDYSLYLNRCVNVRPQGKCKVTIRFNFRGLTGSQNGMNYDATLNYGNNLLNITAKVFNTVPPTLPAQPVLTSSNDTLSFAISISDRRSETKSITIKNTGSALTSPPALSLSNSDNFNILVNRCSKILVANESCTLSLVYIPKLTNSATGTLTIGTKIISLVGARIIDVVPMGSTNTDTMEVEATKTATHEISPLTQGLNMVWSFQSTPPTGMTIDSVTGTVGMTPTLTQIGTQMVQIKATNSAGSYVKNISLIIKPLVDLGTLSFEEGDVGNNLMDIKIKSGVVVTKVVSSNLSDFITPIRVKKDGVAIDNYLRLQDDPSGNTISVNASSVTNFIELTIDGGVKFKSAGVPLQLTLKTAAGDFNYSIPITITTSGLNYIRYDIFGVKGNTVTGDSPTDMLENMAEYKRVTGGWRRPIITKFRVKELNCGSGNIDKFYGDQVAIKNCMNSNASNDSETGFWFYETWGSSISQIGGQALGLGHGVAIEKNPWFYTMAHEFGHNLGLFHTFESTGNLTNYNAQVYHSGAYYAITEALNHRGMQFPGDWLDYKFDFTAQYGIVAFTYGVGSSDTEVDYFSSKKQSLAGGSGLGLGFFNAPLQNNDQVYLVYDTQAYFGARTSGYACEQSNYNSTTKVWSINCDTTAPMTTASIRNIMSYWRKNNDSTSVFTPGQKLRMEKTLQVNSYLGAQ